MNKRWGRAFGGPYQAIADHLAASLARGLDAAATVAQLDFQEKAQATQAPTAIHFQSAGSDRLSSQDLWQWAVDPHSLCRRAVKLDLAPGGYPLRGRWASPIGCSAQDQRLRRRMRIDTGLLIVLQAPGNTRLLAVAFLSPKHEARFPGHFPQLPAAMANMRKSLDHALGGGSTQSPPNPASYPLSKTERALIPLLLTGQSERQIAIASQRSQNTIHCHVRSIYRKLGVRTRKALCQLMRHTDV